MIQLANAAVTVDDSDSEFILVGFIGQNGGGEGELLHFQRACEFDEQDVDLGMADVYVERNHQGQSSYGGIERVELQRDHLRVVVYGRTAQRLGTRQFDISWTLSADEFARLREGLSAVFRGFDCFVELPDR